MKYSAKPGEFLATEEALRVYQTLIARLQSYAHTEYARLKIGTLFPSSSEKLLEENQKTALKAAGNTQRLLDQGLDELLERVRPLREKPPSRIRERAVATASLEVFQELKSRGLDRQIDLHLVESPRELLGLAASYSHVSLIGEELESPSGIETAESLDDWYLAPESVLGFFKENLEALLAALEAARRIEGVGIEGFSGFHALEEHIAGLGEDSDSEMLRLSLLASRLGSCLDETVSRANEDLRMKIERSSLTLGGADLLAVMSSGEGIRELFQMQMKGVFQEILREAKSRSARELKLAGAETVWLDEIFPEEICYPIELNRQALRSFEQDLRSRIEGRGLKSRRQLARGLMDMRETAQELIHALMEFDFLHALGRFALEEHLVLPKIVSEPCLHFEGGRNLVLDEPEPVSYSLGSRSHPENVAVLSGVNSGGKTSLLDLVAQIVILGHMGLPVPAQRCCIGLFQELYYFSKSRGTLSAGAFETAMRKFSVVENRKRKLVLADELEAITEPGASARIIACMLDELNRMGCAAIFVSHLAEDIRRCAETAVRIDGIEASGLDGDNNLIVNRSPRYDYLAKSTPELILERLVRSTEGAEREFYVRLLAKFR